MDLAFHPQPAALTPPPATTGTRPRSFFVAAALAWAFPGLGQLYVGRPGKALVMLVAIGGLFYGGLALSGFTAVNPKVYELEFGAHAFLGAPTAAAYYLTRDLQLTELMPWLEVGRLYAAVAGLLNVVAICDALGDVRDHNRQLRAHNESRRAWLLQQQQELHEFEQRALAIEAQLRMPPETPPPASPLPPVSPPPSDWPQAPGSEPEPGTGEGEPEPERPL